MEEINRQIEAIKISLQLLKAMDEITQTGIDSILLGLDGLKDMIEILDISDNNFNQKINIEWN